MIGFESPALLWGLLAAAIPLAIHLFFRRRPRPTPFPAIDFILRARKETQRRLRLRKLLLFTARTLLLAAVAAALARPRVEAPGAAQAAEAQGPRATAIVLDASGSMGFRPGGGGRPLFERARADALEALRDLAPEEPATAVVCDGTPPEAAPPGFDRGLVRRALEGAQVRAVHADLSACVAAAVRALSEARGQEGLGKRVVVASDLAASAWRLDGPAPLVEGPKGKVRPEVTVKDAARGEPMPNAAVTALAAEPDPGVGPRGYRFTATVANHAAEPLRDVPLVLRTGADGKIAIRAFVDVPAGGAARKTLSWAFPQGGPAALSLALPEDGLAEDDARALALVVPRDVRVLLVNGDPSPIRYRDEAYFVESALASPASPVRAKLVDAEAFPKEDLAGFDAVFLLNVRGLGGKAGELRDFVERGGGLFVSMGDRVDPESYADELAGLLPVPLHVVKTAAERGPGAEARAARFGEVDLEHPAMSIFTGEAREGLVGARFYRYALAKPGARGGQARVVASFDDGAPALVEARRGQGRVLLFTSSVDRDWTDWPIRTSFLPVVQRFAAWLAGGLEERHELPTPVGVPRPVALEPGEALAGLAGPDGRERRGAELAGLVDDAGEGPRVRATAPGLWTPIVAAGGTERAAPERAFAAYLDARESDTRRLAPEELTAWFGGEAVAQVEGRAGGEVRRELPLWTLLLVLGLAAFFLEGVLLR